MPTVHRQEGSRFHFYSDEATPREPMRLHVARDGLEATIRTGGEVELADDHGLSRRELAMVSMIVRARRREAQEAWRGHSC